MVDGRRWRTYGRTYGIGYLPHGGT